MMEIVSNMTKYASTDVNGLSDPIVYRGIEDEWYVQTIQLSQPNATEACILEQLDATS